MLGVFVISSREIDGLQAIIMGSKSSISILKYQEWIVTDFYELGTR